MTLAPAGGYGGDGPPMAWAGSRTPDAAGRP